MRRTYAANPASQRRSPLQAVLPRPLSPRRKGLHELVAAEASMQCREMAPGVPFAKVHFIGHRHTMPAVEQPQAPAKH